MALSNVLTRWSVGFWGWLTTPLVKNNFKRNYSCKKSDRPLVLFALPLSLNTHNLQFLLMNNCNYEFFQYSLQMVIECILLLIGAIIFFCNSWDTSTCFAGIFSLLSCLILVRNNNWYIYFYIFQITDTKSDLNCLIWSWRWDWLRDN